MKLVAISLRIHLERLLRDKAFWVVVVLVWLGLAAAGLLLHSQVPVAMVRAGVVFSGDDPVALAVYESLPEHTTIRFTAFSPQEREAVEHMVQTGRLECAYVLEAPFSARLQQRGLKQPVERIVSPSTVGDVILDEMIFAAVMRVHAPAITAGIILEVFPGSDPYWVDTYVQQRLAWYETEGADQFLQQEAEMVGGVANRPAATGVRQLHGVVAVFLLALVLFSLPRLIAEKTPGLWSRLGFGGLLRYYGGVWGALWCWCLLAGLPAVLLLKIAYPGAVLPLLQGGAVLAAYTAALCAIGVYLAVVLRSPDALFAGSAFVLLAAVLLGGVLLDWAEISGQVGAVTRWLPTEQYISGAAAGRIEAVQELCTMAVAAMLAAAGCLFLRTKQGRY